MISNCIEQFTEAIFSYLNVNVSEIKKMHRNNMLPESFYNSWLVKQTSKKNLEKNLKKKSSFFFLLINPCYSQRVSKTPPEGGDPRVELKLSLFSHQNNFCRALMRT